MIDVNPETRLPAPRSEEISTVSHSWWMCRYCEVGEEDVPLTSMAARTRAYAHAARCTKRPPSSSVLPEETAAYREVWTAALSRQLSVVGHRINDLHTEIRQAPFWRRAIVARRNHPTIVKFCLCEAGIHMLAAKLGLPQDWSDVRPDV